MFIWIMLALAAIWVGLAIWGYLDNQNPKQKKVEVKKTEKVDKGKTSLEKTKQEANAYLREQGYKSTVHISSGTSRTFTATSAPSKKRSDSSVAARKQTSTSTPSRNTSRDRNDDDYNSGLTFGALGSTYSDDSSSNKCFGGGYNHSNNDSGGSDGGGSISCD
ncbi:hypothetical protein MCCARTNEY_238 [Bacillus phage vB_BanH_McCartney]|nr:hypothetical protein MCCARTNEY_238 [Bacillus phage vB_BanH_McCartney]